MNACLCAFTSGSSFSYGRFPNLDTSIWSVILRTKPLGPWGKSYGEKLARGLQELIPGSLACEMANSMHQIALTNHNSYAGCGIQIGGLLLCRDDMLEDFRRGNEEEARRQREAAEKAACERAQATLAQMQVSQGQGSQSNWSSQPQNYPPAPSWQVRHARKPSIVPQKLRWIKYNLKTLNSAPEIEIGNVQSGVSRSGSYDLGFAWV